jgi:hypothetical protein
MELLPQPFSASGQWYRGCLHVHTTESDGAMAPQRLIEHYLMGGFDFIAVTDHEKITDCTHLSSRDFLILRGAEYRGGPAAAGSVFHIVGINPEDEFRRRDGMSSQDVIDEIRRVGGEAIIAHPYWSGLTTADLLSVRNYLAIEVFNATCETAIARGLSSVHWDDLLTRGRLVWAVAADDSHRPGFDSLRAWAVVRAPALTKGAIMDALRQGHFYASTGPEIYNVQVNGTEVRVECSPVQTIALVADPTKGAQLGAGRYGPATRARRLRGPQLAQAICDGDALTGAIFTLRGTEKYARVEITDVQGRRAWTNPLFLRTDERSVGP